MIQALIFDFDGLILDTEAPIYRSWVELYWSYGLELSFDAWMTSVGTGLQDSPFDPHVDLEARLGRKIPWEDVGPRRQERELQLVREQHILPGVLAYIEEARRQDLKLGVASSSDHQWVDTHLKRLELYDRFDTIQCSDDVVLTKPDPALYLSAARALSVEPAHSLALEDSPLGVQAAKRAGMYCVAVPNEITGRMTFGEVDLMLKSLEELSLEQLLARIERTDGRSRPR